MSLEFNCPECQAAMNVSPSMAGRRIRCPECDELVQVPELEPEAPQPEASSTEASSTEAQSAAAQSPADLLPGPAESPAVAAAQADRPSAYGGGYDEQQDGEWDDGDWDGDWDDEDEDWDDEDETPRLGEKKPMAEGEMDMTPMVDVTFLLLIFFMVTAAFSLQKSIQIPKPEQTDEPSTNVVEEPDESPDIVTVQIDEYNTFTVLTADWEKEAGGEIDLIAKLREARQGNDAGVVPSELLVKAHGKALHYRVVMALDAGSETGFEEVQLMTVDGEF